MPFTFSHPAIVVPLSKTRLRLSLTGLVVGSVVPDFEFFFRMRVTENIGHHLPGFFLFDIPAAIMLCFVFHNTVKNELINNLPLWFRSRFSNQSGLNWNEYAASNKIRLLASIIVGIGSHFLWDAFTHYDGAFVMLLPALSVNLEFFKFSIPVYSILQVVSSVWGLWMMYRFIDAMPLQSEIKRDEKANFYRIMFALISIFILAMRIIMFPEYKTFWDLFMAVMGSMTYSCITSALISNKTKSISWQEQ